MVIVFWFLYRKALPLSSDLIAIVLEYIILLNIYWSTISCSSDVNSSFCEVVFLGF